MPTLYFVTHPDVVVDPAVPVPRWPLSGRGRERMCRLLEQPWVAGIGAVFCSTEQKAIDGAAILAAHLGLAHDEVASLGENDRSSTGYLPGDEFQAVADQFFARPQESVRGWERAVDAQRRIVAAVTALAEDRSQASSIAVISHGGVGALLLCHLLRTPISRRHDQPGRNGGNYFAFEQPAGRLLHGWREIDTKEDRLVRGSD